jgi:hypothetical protein
MRFSGDELVDIKTGDTCVDFKIFMLWKRFAVSIYCVFKLALCNKADLAFTAAEVVGAGAALKAPTAIKELWVIAPHVKTLPGIPIVRPAYALPGATTEAAGVAWDSINGAIDQSKK